MCHECLMVGRPGELCAGLCRFCFVALCKTHLIELYRDPPSFPQYTCRHLPASSPAESSGHRVQATPQPVPRPERDRHPNPSPRLAPGFGSI